MNTWNLIKVLWGVATVFVKMPAVIPLTIKTMVTTIPCNLSPSCFSAALRAQLSEKRSRGFEVHIRDDFPLFLFSLHQTPPSLKPFRPDDFFQTVETSGPQLTSGTKGNWLGLYKRFMKSVNFERWLSRRRAEMEMKVASLHLVSLSETVSQQKKHVLLILFLGCFRQSLCERGRSNSMTFAQKAVISSQMKG